MPKYVIERQYLVPVFQHLEIEAPDFETACQQAIDADNWDDAREDGDNARATTLTEAVKLPAGYQHADPAIGSSALCHALYHAGLQKMEIPARFTEGGEDGALRAELAELDAEPDDGPADIADRRREILNQLDGRNREKLKALGIL